MAFEHYVVSGQRKLRCGYTTGTCAALASAGAAQLLLTGRAPETLRLKTPAGLTVEVEPEYCSLRGDAAVCAVRKDGGDDVDATDGCLIVAEVRCTEEPGITITGGAGVGRVTKPGLDQPVGAYAINSAPRRQIAEAIKAVLAALNEKSGLIVTITVPGGAELAKKTFNPQLGIEGGISILGTSGIVEPMSERAIVETIRLNIRQAAAEGREKLILAPGNYALAFVKESGLSAAGISVIKVSNFIGDAFDMAAAEGVRSVLLVGHIGKLVKLAGGIMNTHSRTADCRAELFTAHAALCGADSALLHALMAAPTADACLALLTEAGLRERVLASLLGAIGRQIKKRAGNMRAGALVFSNQYGFLGMTQSAEEVLEEWCISWEPDRARPT